MWLRRLVAIFMILTCVGLNILTIAGAVVPVKVKKSAAVSSAKQSQIAEVIPAPTLTLAGDPTTIVAGGNSALTWSTTGNPTSCKATGSWDGDKTIFGSESTGRISTSGNYTYSMVCENKGGKAEAATTITVGDAPRPKQANVTTSTPNQSAATYCGSRQPCYGPHDVAGHGSSGNCWGWNSDKVIDISGFDAAYHQTKSAISNIQIGQICGKDLAPSLRGDVAAEGKTRNHNQSTKNNTDSSEQPYFVGYFDASKP